MRFLTIALLFSTAAAVGGDYTLEQVAVRLGIYIASLNGDRVVLETMLANYSPVVQGKAAQDQAAKFWDDFLATNRLATNAAVMLETFYFNYNNTNATLSYGSDCKLEEPEVLP